MRISLSQHTHTHSAPVHLIGKTKHGLIHHHSRIESVTRSLSDEYLVISVSEVGSISARWWAGWGYVKLSISRPHLFGERRGFSERTAYSGRPVYNALHLPPIP